MKTIILVISLALNAALVVSGIALHKGAVILHEELIKEHAALGECEATRDMTPHPPFIAIPSTKSK